MPEEPLQLVKRLYQQQNDIAIWEYVENRETCDYGVSSSVFSGPGFGNVLYSSLLNMDFTHRTRVTAFVDDLLVLTRGKWALDAENYADQDLKKTENWARETKMHFNENKSQVFKITT